MDQRLVDAARLGDVNSLHKILEDDPLMLKKVSLALLAESPLHVAALAGKVDFVKEMISLMPSFATQTNQQGLVPLHMASAEGHVEIVRELLKLKLEVNQCLLQDNFGRTPLHYAASKGKIGVIEELISYCPESLEEVTAEGETVLHLAVKGNQLGAMQKLMERLKTLDNFEDLLKAKDKKGNTVCELAAAKKQFQLLGMDKSDLISVECQRPPETSKADKGITEKDGQSAKKEKGGESHQSTLVVATLILTLTYQAMVNPPPFFLKNGHEIDWGCVSKSMQGKHFSIQSLRNCQAVWAATFLMVNTATFLATINLMVFTGGSLDLLLRLSSTALTADYCILLAALSPYTLYVTLPILVPLEIYLCSLLAGQMREKLQKTNFRDKLLEIKFSEILRSLFSKKEGENN